MPFIVIQCHFRRPPHKPQRDSNGTRTGLDRGLDRDSTGGRSREQTEGRLLQSKIVGVDGRWGENSFSGTIAQQTRIFAPANNNRPQTSLPRRNKLSESPIHKKSDYQKSIARTLQQTIKQTTMGLERRQKPRADRSKKSGQGNRRFGRLVKNRCQTCLNRYFLNNIP